MGLYTFFDVCMPYFLEKQPDGKYVAFNRESQPIGFNSPKGERDTAKWAETQPIEMSIRIIESDLDKLWGGDGEANLDRIYLYDNITSPKKSKKAMDAYLEKIRILSGRKLRKERRHSLKSDFKFPSRAGK